MGQTEEDLRGLRWRFFKTVQPLSFLKFRSLLMELRQNINEHKLQLDTFVLPPNGILQQKRIKQQHMKEKSNSYAEEGTEEVTSVKHAV